MTPKPPTPQGISALLKRAGFERSEYSYPGGSGDGFRASRDRDDERAVKVTHRFGGVARHGDMDRAREELAKYAEAVEAAGWTVEAGEYELTVTAPPETTETAGKEGR